MKDEIKLKDMTDFLENVYKDIKKQPTLEEELEKERKFINKVIMVDIKATKELHCYKCGILTQEKPHRLNLQEYGISRWKQYTSTGTNIDLCDKCFKEFVKWVGVNNVKKKIRKRETSKDDWRIKRC